MGGRSNLSSFAPCVLKVSQAQTPEFTLNGFGSSEAEHAPDGCQSSAWKAEGSLYPLEVFREMLLQQRIPQAPSIRVATAEAIAAAQTLNTSYYDPSANSIAANCSTESSDESSRPVRVPTITLSNSIAVMPLSLESSHSIAPLAARRGRKGPAPLELPPLAPHLTAEGLYPGIPTPFLGSPSGYSPKFEFAQNPIDFSMDLAAICQDLRSRCPPLHPPSPSREGSTTPVPLLSDSDSSDKPGSDSGSDDWAFAKDFLATHGGSEPGETSETGHTTEESPRATSDEGDSFSWDSAPTLTNSPRSDNDASDNSAPTTPEQASKESAQRRRRTVIIETPRNSMNVKPARITVDLSHLADDSDDATTATPITAEFDTPLPVEVSDSSDFASALQSTPHLRPMSNATIRPIRSILKTREKKRVRFSLMPGQGCDSDPDSTDGLGSAFEDDTPEGACKGRERAATVPMCRRPDSPHHTRSTSMQASSAKRASFPKHPAVKPFVHHTQPALDSTPTPTPTPKSTKGRQSLQFMPRVVDKCEVGSPRKLTSSIARRSMPAEKSHGKRSSKDENAGRRASEGGKLAQKVSSPQKSRMPFKSILGKFRV